MNETVLRSFSRVLRLQLAAVQQHFIHILLLRAWKEEAVADRITSIDAVDLPNAMRIVDWLVSAGHLPALASDRETLAGDMPEPGASLDAVFAAELALDLKLRDVHASVERELTPCARTVPIELVSVPLAIRASYQDWLRRRLDRAPEGVKAGEPGDPAGLALDSLFANLMVMINQTLVHAFVHWHRSEHERADVAWEMSGAAMMHATSIVNALAPRHVAPQPGRAVVRGDVAPPRAGPPPLSGGTRTSRPPMAGSRPTLPSSEAGDRAASFPGSTTTPASTWSGFFASTCGADAPAPLPPRRRRRRQVPRACASMRVHIHIHSCLRALARARDASFGLRSGGGRVPESRPVTPDAEIRPHPSGMSVRTMTPVRSIRRTSRSS